MKHLKFVARTILVQNADVDAATKALQRVLSSEKIIENARRWQYYEKPYQRRNRLSFEKCIQTYNSEMEKKIRFLMHKSRQNPYPWD
jgi:ribosomal protein S21